MKEGMRTSFADSEERRQGSGRLSGAPLFPGANSSAGVFTMTNLDIGRASSHVEGLELLPIASALNLYKDLIDKKRNDLKRSGALVDPDAFAVPANPLGYFLRLKKGIKITLPCNVAFVIARTGIRQNTHNIVILEEDSELTLNIGCSMAAKAALGSHCSVSEQYVGERAKLTITMTHSFPKEATVRSESVTNMGAASSLVSDFRSFMPSTESIITPCVYLNGEGASAKCSTAIAAHDGTVVEAGGDIYLNAPTTSAELIHKAVCSGGTIRQKGLVIGAVPCRAHVDCAGLLVGRANEGEILSVPGVKAMHTEAKLSHEASVGRIAPEQIEYLETRGIDKNTAISMLIHGFFGAALSGWSQDLYIENNAIETMMGHGGE